MLLQFLQHFAIEFTFLIDHVHIFQHNHIVLYLLQPQIHRILQNLDLLRAITILLIVVDQQNRSQVLRGQHNFIIMVAQPVIQHVSNRTHEDVEQSLHKSDEGCEEETD